MKKHRVLKGIVGVLFGVILVPAAESAGFDFRNLDLNRAVGVVKDAGTAASGISEKDEITIGRNVAGSTLGAANLVNDPALQTYVNKVGRWIASQSERPDLPWRFGIIETSTVNAFAAPGGYVLITRGLYEILENEAQLAGVLGHEISHIVRRHHIDVMRKSALTSAGAGVAGMAVQQRGGSASSLVDTLIGKGAEIFARGLDKDAEFEADHLGVVLAARAGYSPYGLVEVLHKLQARGANDASLALLFTTHPAAGDRLGKLGDAMTPRIATLPAGQEPRIQAVSADAPRAPAGPAAQAVPAGARALQDPGPGASQPGGSQKGGFDAGGLLRGIMGR